ncbi:hypothetical protein [Virgibacillus chiguensis]|uniref:hypothetical protein n=1 Tax=Virgibacillus chiguensis TaxID=411959 RepID=UPI00148157C0|nr:hypothetical protein [Virgibacillus chiguensis]
MKYSSPNNVFLQYLGMFALSFILSVESPGATAAGSLFGLTPILSAIFSIGGGS